MIVDSSALVAIIHDEDDSLRLAQALSASESSRMSVVNWVEAAVVVDSAKDPVASRRFDALIEIAGIELVPVTAEHAALARRAYQDFGKGSRSKAKLNFGDCFAYALAAERREPLLFKGNDFVHTDIEPA